MAEKSLFAVLLRSPWWISMVVAAVIALLAKAFGPAQYANGMALGGFPFVVIGLLALRRQWGVPSAAQVAAMLPRLVAMPWAEFSAALRAAYERQGYQVKPCTGAADFELVQSGRTTLVLARRWKAGVSSRSGPRNIPTSPCRANQPGAAAANCRNNITMSWTRS